MGRDRAARAEAKPLRLFIAVDVPTAVSASLASAVDPYRHRIPGGRWTNAGGWHITLKFLGATWPRLVDGVRAAVVEAARTAGAFETALTQIGVFPSSRRARVVWAGLSDPEHRFSRLAGDLDRILQEDFEPDRRSLTPHLTLARLSSPRDLAEFAGDLVGKSVASEPFRVEELVLYRSHLSPKGATYEPLLRAPFGADA